jgi:N-glycosylase/DNA lyase
MKLFSHSFTAQNYDLALTLNSGQSFRWNATEDGWEGVIDRRWVLLRQEPGRIICSTAVPVENWDWLAHYLQVDIDLRNVTATFPADEHMRQAVDACRGLRLLRQDPWECLASFILSSTKQIIQIRQVVAAVAKCFGAPLPVPSGHAPAFAFPGPDVLAAVTEEELRACKMGFRAPYLKATAQAISNGEFNLEEIAGMDLESARRGLVQLPGVGPKIADCVLLFAFGFPTAFPLDVWILRALRQLYFPGKKPTMRRLIKFSETHFGPYSGYAQQYLFHAVRTGKVQLSGGRKPRKPQH